MLFLRHSVYSQVICGQIALKGLMLNMPPQGAVLLNMVSLSLSFDAFLVLIVIVFFSFFLLSVFLMNKDVYIVKMSNVKV